MTTEELKDIKEKEAKWYVVHTYSGHENKVKANIEKLVVNRGNDIDIFEVVVPTVKEETETGKIKERQHRYARQNKYGRICNGRFISNIIFRRC